MRKAEIDNVVERIRSHQREARAHYRGAEAYSKLIEGLMLLHKGGGINAEYELYEALKELALLTPEDKLEVAREYRRTLKGDSYMTLDLKIRKLIYQMISKLLSDEGINILVPFSATGSLIDKFALNYKKANIISEEADSDEAELQRKLFKACGIENVEVKATYSLKSSHDKKFDLIISQPPIGLKISPKDIELRKFDIKKYHKLDAEKGFILKSLELVKEGGLVLGVFTPGFLFGRKYEIIRNLITEKMNVLSVIETPKYVYKKQNRNAAIVIMKAKRNDDDKVESVLMASFEELKIKSDKFNSEMEELLQKWNEYVEDELNVN